MHFLILINYLGKRTLGRNAIFYFKLFNQIFKYLKTKLLKKNKDWVDIAKLARISWYKKYQLNKEYSYDSANGAIRHFVKPV
jgi:hypothetical protein